MSEAVSLWPLLGVLMVVLGFALRLNPALVVVVSGVATGLIAGMSPTQVLALLGSAFVKNRYLALLILTLPVVSLLEQHGLREQARHLILRLRGATAGRLMLAYLAVRQLLSAIGLHSLGGHPQTVRPLLAPMTEAAAEAQHPGLSDSDRERLRALAASTDNVGLFFGEDIFIAFGGVLLMQSFLADNGIHIEPLQIAVWGIPTAICAFAIHGTRLLAEDRRLQSRQRLGDDA